MDSISGIYKIVNKINGKFYLGSSKDINKRWENEHKKLLAENKHINKHLQAAWNKYGAINFELHIIEKCEISDLFSREQYYLDTLTPWGNIGYNLSKIAGGGDNISYHPNLNEIRNKQRINSIKRWETMSETERLKISENQKGNLNPNWKGGCKNSTCMDCNKIISRRATRCSKCAKKGEKNPFFKNQHSQNTKEILKNAHLGKRHSNDVIKVCRDKSISFWNSDAGKTQKEIQSNKIKGEKHPLYGKTRSRETIDKIVNTKIEKNKNRSISEKLEQKCLRGYFILRYKDFYYLSYDIMSAHLKQDKTTLRFKCLHKAEKWKDYEAIKVSKTTSNEFRNFLIKKLEANQANLDIALRNYS